VNRKRAAGAVPAITPEATPDAPGICASETNGSAMLIQSGESMKQIAMPLFVMVVISIAGCASSHDNESASTPPAPTQPSALDLHNTVCPVSGEKVGSSKLTETYQGKIYHFCCDDCPKDFRKDPEKYAKAVAADPAKYGVK
jgi:YHS domain-containing protein